jgi:hypothetical protein
LTANLTLRTDVNWVFEKGAIVNTTGHILDVNNAPILAGEYQIFTGTGSVINLQYTREAWFGTGYNNLALARTAAVKPTVNYTYVPRTYGTYETAAASSVTANSGVGQTKQNTQVLGTNTQGLAQVYTDRDHVAQYVSVQSYTPDVLNSSTTYTSTSIRMLLFPV